VKVKRGRTSPLSMVPYRGLNSSVRPEEDDDEAKRLMGDEMRGLLCGTNRTEIIDLDDTASEESFDLSRDSAPTALPITTPVAAPAPFSPSSEITCNVCTTAHPAPAPICCESCANVLEPTNLPKDKIWTCPAQGCLASELGYTNSVDAGICGICGHRKP
jgi:hypothetical protein